MHAPLLFGERDGGAGAGGDDTHPPFDLLGALHDFVLRMFASLGLCAKPPLPLTETQKLRLAKLTKRVEVPYDAGNKDHSTQLTTLWRVTFPGREELQPSDPNSSKNEGWKDMGWQGTDPATDFRSGGVLSLENLLWFAVNDHETYERIQKKKTGTRSEWEYPFAAAGVNVTFNLVDLLELRTRKAIGSAGVVDRGDGGLTDERSTPEPIKVPSSPAAVAFLDLLDPGARQEQTGEVDISGNNSGNPDFAFEQMYVTFWEVFDNEWLDRKATYMEFSQVMQSCREKVRIALEKGGKQAGGCTLGGVREMLGLKPL